MLKFSLQQLAKEVGGAIRGDGNVTINSIAPLEKAGYEQLTFLSNKRLRDQLINSKASVIILTEEDVVYSNPNSNLLIVDDTYLAYANVAKLLDSTPSPALEISHNANIDKSVILGVNNYIGANTVISANVKLGNNVVIGSGCFIGENTIIGDNTKIWSNISIYHNVIIGKNCLIQANSVIGSDGFGYANDKGEWVKIPQLGSVVIGNNVEIGACTCIDRGALDNTIIEDNVIIDNLCQIAHNVHIGTGTAVAGAVTIAGSSSIGRYCLIGGASVINGHISICDKVTITGMTMLMRSIKKPGVYSSGIPAQTNAKWHKTAALTLRIDELYGKIKKLERNTK